MAQKIGGIVFAVAVGLLATWLALQSKPTADDRARRALEEVMVTRATAAARTLLGDGQDLQIADPLNPNRVAGKSFVYPVDSGFEVSGYYRRGPGTLWMPWLVRLDSRGDVLAASANTRDGTIEWSGEDPAGRDDQAP